MLLEDDDDEATLIAVATRGRVSWNLRVIWLQLEVVVAVLTRSATLM